MNWMTDAACATTDPELFFPEKEGWASAEMAKAICNTCSVLDLCREAFIDEEHGIWAGMSPRERAELRAQREAA